MRRSLLVAVLSAVMVVAMGATAFAGEVNGKGEETGARTQSNSICSYSGLNDDPTGEDPDNGPPGRTQSFGQDVRMGFIDPRLFNPGDACHGGSNPNRA